MEALRIKNLRCLTDTGRVPIRPITLLVGKNSSGKSTYLRTFPLLRQSVETARESPILWYHERFVDFGSFDEAVNEHAKERTISFEFELPVDDWDVELESCSLTMTLAGHADGSAYVQAYEIRAEGQRVEIALDRAGFVTDFRTNGRPVDRGSLSLQLSRPAFLLPTIEADTAQQVSYTKYFKRTKDLGEEEQAEPLLHSDPWRVPLVDALRKIVPPGTHANILDNWTGVMPAASAEGVDAAMTRTEKKAWTDCHLTDAELTTLLPSLFAGRANRIIAAADAAIADFASHVAYLAPLRATAVRGYRVQDLSVSEVDPRGENLAMFLRSLPPEDVQSFADFTRRHLDFDASLRILGLHADIFVREALGSRAKNLVDVGSGHAQVLPLAAILWSTCVRKARRDNGRTSLLAIEQPELHLHPAHQAKLTRMFAGAMLESRGAGRPVKLLIETHSEALVNGFGDLIHEKVLSPEDVQIAIFDQDDDTRQTSVRLASYDEDGALRNWPYGFFNPIDERREAAE